VYALKRDGSLRWELDRPAAYLLRRGHRCPTQALCWDVRRLLRDWPEEPRGKGKCRMGLGMASDEWGDERHPRDVFAALASALETIGKVKETDESEGFIRGRTRYGLQVVRLKIHVTTGPDSGSHVSVEALADDVWGAGARKGIAKLRKASAP
jgi:hypothetical protein